MCGIFGFVSKDGSRPSMSLLNKIAAVTMSRGPHAWGMAWVDQSGTMRTYKQSGRIVDHLGLLAMARDAVMLVGHCRWATHGDPSDNLNNHPHDAGDAWVIHNGQIRNYLDLAKRHRLRRHTQCDSEVLGLMISKFKGTPLKRVKSAVDQAMGTHPLSMMALWPDRMIVAKANSQPLSVGETKKAYYIASLQEGLPGYVEEMNDNEIVEYS
jgi:glucosamine--fructose-6-phosphate aminotransferase (isomerizing)